MSLFRYLHGFSSLVRHFSSQRLPARLLTLLAFVFAGMASAQVTATVTSPGTVAVGSTGTYTVNFTFHAQFYYLREDRNVDLNFPFDIRTSGVNGGDFSFQSSNCASLYGYGPGESTTCSMNVNFTPKVPGARLGSVILYANLSPNGTIPNPSVAPPVAALLLNGVATGPYGQFSTGVTTTPITDGTNIVATTVDGGGNIYYADQGTESIYELASGATTPTVVVSGINQVTGLAIDGLGNLFYGSSGDNKVYQIGYPGANGYNGSNASFAVTAPGTAMTVDGNGTVYVTSGANIIKIVPSTPAVSTLATISATGAVIGGIAVDSAGNVYATDTHGNSVYKIAAGTGTATALTTTDSGGTNELSGPRGVVFDCGGNLYVANATSKKVLRLAASSWTQTATALTGSVYTQLAFDTANNLYAVTGTTISEWNRSTVNLTYASVVLGTPSPQQTVTLENDGSLGSSLNISSLTTGTSNADTGGAATTCTTSSTLAPLGTCMLGVRFNPTTATTTSGVVTITDNSPNAQVINLTGSTANDPQTITFPTLSTPSAIGRGATLAATASSGLAVTYSISGPGTLSSSNGVSSVTYTGNGTVQITATQTGNTNYAAATPVVVTVQVATAPVITFTPPASGLVGTPITLTATSTQSATPVTFSVISGPATVAGTQLTFTNHGTVVVAADQAGNSSYPSAVEVQKSITVYSPQTITFTPVTPVAPGTSTTLTATASSGLGVSFAIVSGPATLNGNTITYNAVGAVVISASQAGNGSYAAATPVQATVNVVARPVISFSLPAKATLGSTITLSATSTQSGSPVTYSLIRGVATLSGATLTLTSGGPVVIAADQAGTANYPAALEVQQIVNVQGGATSTALAVTSGGTSVNSIVAGQVLTLTATVASGSGHPAHGQVIFCDGPVSTPCTLPHQLGTVQMVESGAAAGTATLRLTPSFQAHNYSAIYLENSTYASSVSALTPVALGDSNTTTLISQSGSPGNYTLTGTVLGALGTAPQGPVNFLDESNNFNQLATTTLVPGNTTFSLNIASTPAVTGSPVASITADFNGDGIPDVAVVNNLTNNVTILLGTGYGSFNAASTVSVGNGPDAIASGDFNGDGITDLVVANGNDGTYTILLGLGNGTFNATTSAPVTSGGQSSMAVGDFNGDGIADIAIPSNSPGTVVILLGKGDGTFTASSTPGNSSYTYSVAVGDFNRDGIQDLAVGGYGGNLGILLGNGDGTFKTGVNYSQGGATSISLGDFNGDGMIDMVTANYNGSISSVSMLLGVGDGTFTVSNISFSSALPYIYSVGAGDFNGDGKTDIVVGGEGLSTVNFDGVTAVALGKGDGTFTVQSAVPFDNSQGEDYVFPIAVADYNKDGLADVFVAASTYNDYPPNFYDTAATVLSATQSISTATVTGINPTSSGTHNVAAFYTGQGVYSSGFSATTALTATNLLPNAITFPQPASPVALNGTATLAATSTSGTVLYTVTAGTATINGSTITYTTGGTVQITASSPASSTYAAATPVTVTVVVSQPQSSLSWLPSTLNIFTGTALSAGILDATDSIPATITYAQYLLSASPSTASAVSVGTLLSQGSYGLVATVVPSDPNYAAESLTVPFTVQNMNVFVAASSSMLSFYNNGNVQTAATAGGGIGAAVDSLGNVWSINADGSGISRFSDAGALLATYAVGKSATALAVDGLGKIWITNANGTITALNNDGSVAADGLGDDANLSSPASISVDTAGSLWIANKGNHTVTETFGEAASAAPISAAVYNNTPGTRP
jgi:hypothetical protein